MNAEILSIGTELLMGQISNTNAQFLSQRLSELGINVYYHNVVGDNKKRAVDTLKMVLQRSDIVITTGGLGPTQDDLTKEIIAEVLNLELELDDKSLKFIEDIFMKINRKMTASNIKQAYFPKGSLILDNKNGTAPGCIVEVDNKIIIVLPGPPRELKPMFDESVYPYLLNKQERVIKSSYIKVFGVGESKIENLLIDLVNNQTNPTIATYGSESDVLVRVTANGIDINYLDQIIKDYELKIHKILGDSIYSYNNLSLEDVVGKMLIDKNQTISIAESCTAGMISSLIANVEGISKVFSNSSITYSNDAKIKMLNVKEQTLEEFGAVSKETAIEMAIGIRKYSKTDIGVSVTGIAGPGGSTLTKPVGLVYIAISTAKYTKSFKLILTGNRQKIRLLASMNVLDMIRKYLLYN